MLLLAYAYIIHLLSGFVLLGSFFWIYTKKITPFDEVSLIAQGLSLGGAVLGFSLTVASSILHSSTFLMFLGWGAGAMVVQGLCYGAITRVLPQMNDAITQNNAAMGALMGTASLTVGIINAACLS